MSSKHDLVDRLRRMLAKANITDEQLDGGARISQDGLRKAAVALGIDVTEMPLLIRALVQRIRDERRRFDTMNEDMGAPVQRYSFEKDALGNVTVRDARTGNEAFVSGTRASALLNRLTGSAPDQQQKILAAFAHEGKGLSEAERIVPTKKRAMAARDEDPADEVEHWDAHAETGFYGRQGAGCVVVAQDTGRLLVMHRSRSVEEPGTWGNCGGAVDEGANPREHAIQETYEETGYIGTVTAVVPLYTFQKGTFRYSNFLAIVPKEFKPILNWESQGYRWCTIGDWPSPLHFGLQALFSDPESMDKIVRVAGAAKPPVSESIEHLDDLEGPSTDDDDDVEPAILDEEEDFHAEIRRTAGTFNFPWKSGSEHGFGTAAFRGSRDARLSISVISVSNAQGEAFEPHGDLAETIQAQAETFIGHE